MILRRGATAAEIAALAADGPWPSTVAATAPADSATDAPAGPRGVTLAAWIKPAERLGRNNQHPGGGDIIGYGNRRYVLKLIPAGSAPESAPYRLAARLNVNDGITSERTLEAGRWHHVALAAMPENGQRRIRLFIDGEQAAEGLTTTWSE